MSKMISFVYNKLQFCFNNNKNPDPLLMILRTEQQHYSTDDTANGRLDDMILLTTIKRSLQKYAPTLLNDVSIDDEKLISKVLEKNRRGQKKMITKIVCPFCFTSVAPQCRPGNKRLDLTNFNRHLTNIHGGQI